MRTRVALLFACLLLAGCAGGSPKAQSGDDPDFGVKSTESTGVIRGVVVDEAIRPLAGVLVNLTTGQEDVTDAQGAFGFAGLAPGTYFLQASLAGYVTVQQSTEVVAGVDEPDVVRVLLPADPVQRPYVEATSRAGYLNFGASVGITSLGSTFLGGLPNDDAIWNMPFEVVPDWAQGELVWDQTQPAGGMLIWEMVVGGTNDWKGYRETAESPALAFWNTSVLQEQADNVTDNGIDYRFFGGPHPALAPNTVTPPEDECPWIPTVVLGDRNPCRFGYGLTYQQRADAYIHHFYNFAPPEGWRFTEHGDPVVPPV